MKESILVARLVNTCDRYCTLLQNFLDQIILTCGTCLGNRKFYHIFKAPLKKSDKYHTVCIEYSRLKEQLE